MVLRSEKFEVREVPVVTRDGATVTKHVVVHPGAVALLPVLDDGRVVLIRNTRFAVGRTLWEVAAGTLEIGEEPMACAARELREETGYEAATLEPLVQFYSAPGFCTELLHVFVATGLRQVGQALEATEHIEVHPVTVAELERMLDAGDFVDAKTLTTVLLWLRRRERVSR